MKNYKIKQFFENLLLISIILIIIYFIISFIISAFSIKKFALPSFSMPKFDYNITIPKINTDFLLDKFKENNITIKENNISKDNNITKTIINENDTNISVKTFDINKNSINIDNNNTLNIDTNISDESNITNISKSIDINITKKDIILKKPLINKLDEYINSTKESITKHQNKRKLYAKAIKSIKIKVRILPNGKFNKLIYLSGNQALIGEARIALKRTFPIKPSLEIKSKFPIYIITTLKYD